MCAWVLKTASSEKQNGWDEMRWERCQWVPQAQWGRHRRMAGQFEPHSAWLDWHLWRQRVDDREGMRASTHFRKHWNDTGRRCKWICLFVYMTWLLWRAWLLVWSFCSFSYCSFHHKWQYCKETCLFTFCSTPLWEKGHLVWARGSWGVGPRKQGS